MEVELAATLTEVGTLKLHCVAADDPAQRWRLEFQLRADAATRAALGTQLPPRFDDAVAALRRVFGPRERWPLARARRRSADQ